jgi:DNA recombination protein RmuC
MLSIEFMDAWYALGGAAVGALLGLALTALVMGKRRAKENAQLTAELQLKAQALLHCEQQLDAKTDQLHGSQDHNQALQQQVQALGQDAALVPDLRRQLERAQTELTQLRSQHSELKANHEARLAGFEEAAKAHKEKIALMEAAEARLQTQFENLANKIFEQKSASFSKLNKDGLDTLLGPLKDQISGFQKQVNDLYIKEGQERASLKTEILGLKELNQQITTEAAALTQALKGDNKQQGNWGEVVLERILKQSGLREGYEFDTQVSARNDSGKLLQPDVVVHLPNDKDVIIDSKVSLVAYERYFNTQDDSQRQRLLKEHVASLRSHIKLLGAKDYHALKAVKSLDYVLLFIPVEPAFLLAVDEDPELITLALNNNIMLVSPTNLLVALRTINNIWQYEYQNQNAQKIAQHAAKLYDKFFGFVQDMEKVGKSVEATQKHFDSAFSKLSTGRGNIIRQIEQFRELGVQPNKRLPDTQSDIATESND